MRIALIAHDSRKELMAQFCTAYVRILSENDLIGHGRRPAKSSMMPPVCRCARCIREAAAVPSRSLP